jgi:hypothetical protein
MSPEPGTRRRSRLPAFILGTVLLCLVLLFAFAIRWEEKEFDNGYGEAARRNHFLAAELFLGRHGIETETVAGLGLLDALPSSDHLLMLTSSRRALSERRRRNLIEWIEAGGELVVVASEPHRAQRESLSDPLLDQLDIHLIDPTLEIEEEEGEGDEEADSGDEAPTDPAEEEALEDELDIDAIEEQIQELLGEGSSDPLEGCWENEEVLARALSESDADRAAGEDELVLELYGMHHLESAGDSELEFQGPLGSQLLTRRSGAGRITATTSFGIWTNPRIHCHDHAYVLWLLAHSAEKVWLLHDPDIPSLPQLLASSFPLAGMGLAALFLVWGASTSLRFGVEPARTDGERRELLEHLEAGTQFLWRRGLIASTLVQLRGEINELCDRHHGLGDGRSRALSPRERTQILSRLAKRPEEEVASALSGPPPARRRDLVRMTRTLQAIRRTL